MIYFILAVILLAVGIWVCNRSHYEPTSELIGWLVAMMSGIYLGVGGILVMVAQTVEFPAFKAEYDQVVALTQNVKTDAAEDLVGHVAKINATLAKAKVYNKFTFCDPYFSDKFETVPPIVLPDHLKKFE